jgi:hypothetical protein
MVTPQSTVRVPFVKSAAPQSWRAVALWLVLAAVLVAGVVPAAHVGGTGLVLVLVLVLGLVLVLVEAVLR